MYAVALERSAKEILYRAVGVFFAYLGLVMVFMGGMGRMGMAV